jgi:hypothetical protein
MTPHKSLAQKFDEIFDRKLVETQNQRLAYEAAEKEFELEHNCRKYSSAESYRKVRRDRIKNGTIG